MRASWGGVRAGKPSNDNDVALMPRIDKALTAQPFLASRRLTAMRRAEGVRVKPKRIQRLMALMGSAALRPKRNTRKPAPGHKIYPNRLRDVTIERVNHVWAAAITYIQIGRGFLYPAPSSTGRAAPSWRGGCRTRAMSRCFAWRRSKTLWPSPASRRFQQKNATPCCANTDPGSQFPSAAFAGAVTAGVEISTDSRGGWRDNVLIERLWLSLKYANIYIKGYADGCEAEAGIADGIAFYNGPRPHRALAMRPPLAVGREGAERAYTVDIIDNALALLPCPQPKQRTQARAAG